MSYDSYDDYAIGQELGRSMNDLAAEIHEINVSKGFWPDKVEDRNVGEALCLVHSELSEAWDAAKQNIYDDKLTMYPGYQVEIADAVIRVLDLGGAHGIDFEAPIPYSEGLGVLTSFSEDIAALHKRVDDVLEAHRKNELVEDSLAAPVMLYKVLLVDVLFMLLAVGDKYDFDLMMIVEAKMDYNRGRPYKHGKSY